MWQPPTFLIFVSQIYAKRGFLAGNATFDDGATPPLVAASSCVWLRPVIDSQHYPLGWQDPISMDLDGAKFTVPANASVLPGLASNGANPNAVLHFASAVSNTVAISTTDTVTNAPASTSFILKITRSTGFFTGTFTHTDGTKPTFKGLIRQGTSSGGFGFFLTTTPSPMDYNGQSGSATLGPTP